MKRINENARISHYSREKMAREEIKRERVLGIMCHFRGVPRSVSPSRIANFQKKSTSAYAASSASASASNSAAAAAVKKNGVTRPFTAPDLQSKTPQSTLASKGSVGKENQSTGTVSPTKSASKKKLAALRPHTAGPNRANNVEAKGKGEKVAGSRSGAATAGAKSYKVVSGQITYYHGESKSLVQVPSPYSTSYSRDKSRNHEIKGTF